LDSGSGLWKSDDGGASWVNLMSCDINFILADARNPGTIYVQLYGRLYKSTDGGQTFVETQTASCGVLVIDPQNSATLYCSGNDVARSFVVAARSHHIQIQLAGNNSVLVLPGVSVRRIDQNQELGQSARFS
jgi:hypothetical protein